MAVNRNQMMYLRKAKMLWVKDGDTIEAMVDMGFKHYWQTPVRFYGYDAYELSGATAHPLGKVATAFLKAMFDKFGTDFYMLSDRDQIAVYDRVAARLWFETKTEDGKKAFIDVVETMKANGFDKSGVVSYDEKRAPIYKMVVAETIERVLLS